MEEFPGNSKFAKEPENKQITRVVAGRVTRRRPPLSRRLAENIVGDNAKGVFEYVLLDVVLPAAKDVLADAVSSAIERLLYGEVRGRRPRRSSQFGNSYVSYNRYSSGGYNQHRDDPRRTNTQARKERPSFDDIVLDTRADAEEVIQNLIALIDRFEAASVSDLYELVGITAEFTDAKWGWTSPRGMGVTRVGNGYLVDIPAPSPLN